MEQVVARDNLKQALKRVRQNQGSPGIDGMTVDELAPYLVKHWLAVKEQLLAGSYRPKPVKAQAIPKRNGGVRTLGIPCVLDRFIQQAILQVLQPRFDVSFSQHSYGFRPGRSAHQAVCAAQQYIQDGRRWVVDIDLESFFDRVNHDVLMGKLAKRIADKHLMGLIRRYLNAGMMANGVVMDRREGTPQGGPLSPLLANVLLDEVDKELEKRGHAFCRYADDCNVYVRSRRAGEDVKETLKRLYAKLKLRINEQKSAVAKPWDRQFLGFRFWVAKGKIVKRACGSKALEAMKQRVRNITARSGGKSMEQVATELKAYLTGWKEYFRLADTPGVFTNLDGWTRHRLRAVMLKQWKCGTTVYRELRARDLSQHAAASVASSRRSWWAMAGTSALNVALPVTYFDALGVPRLAARA
jgi:group II intron reverse transcriptase/maturase